MNQVKKKTKEACGDNYQMARVMREKVGCRDFLGGTVVKNLPANAGDTG